MSDGPYKSLNMTPAWKKFAEWAHKAAFEPDEVAGVSSLHWKRRGAMKAAAKLSAPSVPSWAMPDRPTCSDRTDPQNSKPRGGIFLPDIRCGA